MLQPVPDKFVPSDELLSARMAAVISFGPQPAGGTKGVLGSVLTGTPSYKQANAQRAKKEVENEVSKWKRYTFIFAQETSESSFFSRCGDYKSSVQRRWCNRHFSTIA